MYDKEEMKKLEEFRELVNQKQEAIITEQKKIKKEDPFSNKRIKELTENYDSLIKELNNVDEKFDEQRKIKEQKRKENEEKLKKDVEELNRIRDENIAKAKEEKAMKEKKAEVLKEEIDRLENFKKWKENQKT